MGTKRQHLGIISFQHTQLGVYLVGSFALLYFFSDRPVQGIIEKYHINKKWFYLYGALMFFAYMYMRPFIRRGLGSAQRGYVNFYTLYICWLCSAVFYHLPSFEALGVDIKADVSLTLSVACSSLTVLALLHALQLLLIHFRILSRVPGVTKKELWSCVLLNSMSLAVACSVYYSLCGNGGISLDQGSISYVKSAVCAKWLAPIMTAQYPKFSAWMLYGEGAGSPLSPNNTSGSSVPPYIHVDFPLDGLGIVTVPAGSVISPVFTMWITLVTLYIVNVLADHAAATQMKARHISELRRQFSEPDMLLLHKLTLDAVADEHLPQRVIRSKSLELEPGGGAGAGGGGMFTPHVLRTVQSFWEGSNTLSQAAAQIMALTDNMQLANIFRPMSATSLTSLFRSQSASMMESNLDVINLSTAASPTGSTPAAPGLGREALQDSTQTGSTSVPPTSQGSFSATAKPFRASAGGLHRHTISHGGHSTYVPIGSDTMGDSDDDTLHSEDASYGGPGVGVGATQHGASSKAPQPAFLDMVPWYSGTSADLFKTMFDLMVSVKLFLGRFDMRTMQAATAASMADSFNDTPSEGDGFTYEHYAERKEVWIDFMADTGDGGNPTYAVARGLAAPTLVAAVSEGVKLSPGEAAGLTPGAAADQGAGGNAAQKCVNASTGAQSAATPGFVELPRADVLLLGGDLAYPNPSRETFEQRLFVPFQDAFPPPPHYHPGRLVVHKPDLPPVYGVQEATCGKDLRGLSPRSSRHASVAALRRYPGPNCFAIPGNHDWIDGLETFIKQIQHKGWLGGWLMPQEKSYFALCLPHGWWVFGLDLALVGDIDMCQYRYFANVVEQRMGPEDQVIIITHEPIWLLEWFWATSTSSNLRQLVRGHLRGRARVHLAGDLHFYMRHSFTVKDKSQHGGHTQPSTQQQATAAEDGNDNVAGDSMEQDKPLAGSQDSSQQQPAGKQYTDHPKQQGGHINGVHSSGLYTNTRGSPTAPVFSKQPSAEGMSSHAATTAGRSEPSIPKATSSELNRTKDNPTGAAAVGVTASSSSTTTAAAAALRDRPATTSAGAEPAGSCSSSSYMPAVAPTKPFNVSPMFGFSARQMQATGGLRPSSSLGVLTESTVADAAAKVSATARQSATDGSRHAATAGAAIPLIARGYSSDRQLSDSSSDSDSLDGAEVGSSKATAARGRSSHTTTGSGRAAGKAVAGVQDASPVRLMRHGLPRLTLSHKALGKCAPLTGAAVAGLNDALCDVCRLRDSMGPSLCDPEHLIVNGMGGAFMHPTHVFSYARFASLPDEAAEATAAIYSTVREQCTCRVYPLSAGGAEGHPESGTWHYPTSPSGASSDIGGTRAAAAVDGEYRCAAVYPAPDKSVQLGKKNLHLFRFKNSRFDVIGGAIYFLSVVSILPRCNSGKAILDASTLLDGLLAFATAFVDCWYAIVMESYLSLFMVVGMFLICLGFARTGGVGACSSKTASSRRPKRASATPFPGATAEAVGGAAAAPLSNSELILGPLVKLRTGGAATQVFVAFIHSMCHLSLAVILLLLLELGVETCIRYESLGTDGMHSLYRWFVSYEDEHFPDPMKLREMLHKWTLGVYPGVIKYAMAVFDIPEAIAVARTAVCTAGGFHVLSRLQLLGYFAGMLAYYWLLAIPAMGAMFGLYLYVCVCKFHVHYDEAFSALRITNFKGFTRMHITPEGDLEIFTLGMDKVPTKWVEDPHWYGPQGGGNRRSLASHKANYPSRWMPADVDDDDQMEEEWGSRRNTRDAKHGQGASGFRLVDYLKVPKKRFLG